MRQLAVVLALVAAFGAVAILHPEGRSTARVDALRHYYALGRKTCRPLAVELSPTPVGNIQTWSGFTSVRASLSRRGVPKEDRAALNAGCQSRVGG
jgi:hypothetical protein